MLQASTMLPNSGPDKPKSKWQRMTGGGVSACQPKNRRILICNLTIPAVSRLVLRSDSGKRFLVFLAASFLAALFSLRHARSASPPDPRKPGTIRMAALLQKLADTADPAKNPFLNKEKISALRQRLARENTSESRYALGSELLNAGENQEALQVFNALKSELAGKTDLPLKSLINLELNRALCFMRMAEFYN